MAFQFPKHSASKHVPPLLRGEIASVRGLLASETARLDALA